MPKQTRSEAEIAALMSGYDRSGLTRREYCRREGVALTTLDYYRHQRKKRKGPALVAVKLIEPQRETAMSLVLRNGRRIEVHAGFAETELAKLVRVAESA
jgi:hypothetical protein